MKRINFGLMVAMLIMVTTVAMAAKPVTRPGADFNGAIPKDCPVFEVEGSSLRVACTSSDERSDPARVRYRFLREYNGVKAPATVSANVDVIKGGTDCYRVQWMAPVRTLRILVPTQRPACEVVIRSVTWSQP